MADWEDHFSRYPPGHLQAEMTAMLIRAVSGMFAKSEDDIPTMEDLCPWLGESTERKAKADRRAAVLRQAQAEATAAGYARLKAARAG